MRYSAEFYALLVLVLIFAILREPIWSLLAAAGAVLYLYIDHNKRP